MTNKKIKINRTNHIFTVDNFGIDEYMDAVVRFDVSGTTSVDGMLIAFYNFLIAVGYKLPESGRLEIITDDEDNFLSESEGGVPPLNCGIGDKQITGALFDNNI
jgi:hypothetical protein